MRAREGVLSSSQFGDQLDHLYPIIESGGSDSAAFDNVLELLVANGVLTLPEAVMMLIPEAWQGNDAMEPEKTSASLRQESCCNKTEQNRNTKWPGAPSGRVTPLPCIIMETPPTTERLGTAKTAPDQGGSRGSI